MSQTTGMLRRIGRRARTNGAPWAVGFFAVTAFVAAVVVIQAWPSSRFEPDVSGTWVVRGDQVGRLNVQIAQIDHVERITGGSDVVQSGQIVDRRATAVLVEPADPGGNRAARRLDPGAVGEIEPVSLTGEVAGGNGRMAWLDGAVLVLSTELGGASTRIDLGIPPQEAGRVAGLEPVVSVDGTAAVLHDRTLHVVDPGATEARREDVGDGTGRQLSFVGSRPVLLDAAARRVTVIGGPQVELLGPVDGARLQLPGPERAEVMIATRDGVIEVPLDGGTPRRTSVDTSSGDPVAPAVDERCTVSAWQTGVAWARCGSAGPELQNLGEGSGWALRSGGAGLVVNAANANTVWLLDGSTGRPEWVGVKWPDIDDADVQQPIQEFALPERNPAPADPVAQPDTADDGLDRRFRARPGRIARLEVLKNDYDPNRDPIVVDSIDAADQRLRVAPDGRAVLLDLREGEMPEQLSFTYRIIDATGRLSQQPVEALVDIVDESVNSAPVAMGPQIAAEVASGQTISVDVGSRFWDPEGDPFFLRSAEAAPGSGHLVQRDPAGWFAFTAASAGETLVTYVVSDGRPGGDSGPQTAKVVVLPPGSARAPIAENDVVVVREGAVLAVSPLANDTDPLGSTLRLEGAPDWEDDRAASWSSVSPDGRSLLLNRPFPSGDYRATYRAVGDRGISEPATLLVRVLPIGDPLEPVARNDVVVVQKGRSAEVDVLRNDTDPGGELLSVVDLSSSGAPSTLVTGAVQRDFRTFSADVGATAPDEVRAFTYTVSNGSGTATADVLVVPEDRKDGPPRAVPQESVRVRAGDVATLQLADVVRDDDGDELAYELAAPVPAGAALGGNVLRFEMPADAAPEVRFDVSVTGTDPDGAAATATVGFVAVVGDGNRPPVARELEARVRPGGTVVIPVPLDEARPPLDPDGDSVQLAGLAATNEAVNARFEADPRLQAVRFTAPTELAGQQVVLQYLLRDARGLVSAPAPIRIAVLPDATANRPPVARPDRLRAAPGAEVSVDPLLNDADLDGDDVRLADKVSGCDAAIVESALGVRRVRLRAPAKAGDTCTATYRVVDAADEPAEGRIEVLSIKDFTGVPPIARDDVVPPPSKGETDAVVDVLANDADPDGDSSALTVTGPGLEPVAGGFRVTIEDQPRRLRYEVQDADGLVSVAYVRVPGRTELLPPQARPRPPIELIAGDPPQEIALDDLVEDPDGRIERFAIGAVPPQLDGTEAGRSLATRRLRLATVDRNVSGTVSLPVEATDDDGLSVVVTLTVVITPADNVPPEWGPASPCREVQRRGGPRQVLLTGFASDDDPLSSPNGQLEFGLEGDRPDGVTAEVRNGNLLYLEAGDTAKDNDVIDLVLTVKDKAPGSQLVRRDCRVQVVPIAEPQPEVGELSVRVEQGTQEPVEVQTAVKNAVGPIRLEVVRLGPGISDVRVDGTQLLVTAAPDFAADTSVDFRVVEEANEGRSAQGVVTVKVVGPPGQMDRPVVTSPAGNTIEVQWVAPQVNGNLPITNYIVTASGLRPKPCGVTQRCTLNLADGVVNGRDGGYTVTVKAVNEVAPDGGPASEPSLPVIVDVPPGPPTVRVLRPSDPQSVEFGEVVFAWTDDGSADRSQVTGWVIRTSSDGVVSGPTNLPKETTSYPVPVRFGRPACIEVAARNSARQNEGLGAFQKKLCFSPDGRPIIGQPVTSIPEKGKLGVTWLVDPNNDDNGKPGTVKSWTITGCNGASGGMQTNNVISATLTCDRGQQALVLTVKNSDDLEATSTAIDTVYNVPVLGVGDLGLSASAGKITVTSAPQQVSSGGGLDDVNRWEILLADGQWSSRKGASPVGMSVSVDGYGARTVQLRACNGPDAGFPLGENCSDAISGTTNGYVKPPDSIFATPGPALTAPEQGNKYTLTFDIAPPAGTNRGDWRYRVDNGQFAAVPSTGPVTVEVNRPNDPVTVTIRYKEFTDTDVSRQAPLPAPPPTTTTTTTLPSGPN